MNIFKISLLVLFGAFVIGCGNVSPDRVAIGFVEDLHNGNSKSVIKSIYFGEKLTQDDVTMLEGKVGMLASEAKVRANQQGGIKSIEVVESDIKENEAKIKLKINFKNGNNDTTALSLINQDSKWLVAIK